MTQAPTAPVDTFEAAPARAAQPTAAPRSLVAAFRSDTFSGFVDGFEGAVRAPVNLSGGAAPIVPDAYELPPAAPVAVSTGFVASLDDLFTDQSADQPPAPVEQASFSADLSDLPATERSEPVVETEPNAGGASVASLVEAVVASGSLESGVASSAEPVVASASLESAVASSDSPLVEPAVAPMKQSSEPVVASASLESGVASSAGPVVPPMEQSSEPVVAPASLESGVASSSEPVVATAGEPSAGAVSASSLVEPPPSPSSDPRAPMELSVAESSTSPMLDVAQRTPASSTPSAPEPSVPGLVPSGAPAPSPLVAESASSATPSPAVEPPAMASTAPAVDLEEDLIALAEALVGRP